MAKFTFGLEPTPDNGRYINGEIYISNQRAFIWAEVTIISGRLCQVYNRQIKLGHYLKAGGIYFCGPIEYNKL